MKKPIKCNSVTIGTTRCGQRVAEIGKYGLTLLRDLDRIIVYGIDIDKESTEDTEATLRIYTDAMKKGQSPYPLDYILKNSLRKKEPKKVMELYPLHEYTWEAYLLQNNPDMDDYIIRIAKNGKTYAFYYLLAFPKRRRGEGEED